MPAAAARAPTINAVTMMPALAAVDKAGGLHTGVAREREVAELDATVAPPAVAVPIGTFVVENVTAEFISLQAEEM